MPRERTGVWLVNEGKRPVRCASIHEAYRRAESRATIQVYSTQRTTYRPQFSVRGVLQKGKSMKRLLAASFGLAAALAAGCYLVTHGHDTLGGSVAGLSMVGFWWVVWEESE